MSDQVPGNCCWAIPDAYLPSGSSGVLDSHEALALLNTGDTPASLSITLFFEDRDPLEKAFLRLPARRTLHIRTDELELPDRFELPRDVPYALLVESDLPIFVQYSRMDTRSSELALMTTMAHPV